LDTAGSKALAALEERRKAMSMAHASIDQHPDLLALRASYERAAESGTAQTTFGLILLGGLYAALSPWIVGFGATTNLALNDLIVGITVALLALGLGAALDRSHGVAWTLPLLGVWLIIAPWVVNDVTVSVGTAWSNVVVGAVIVVLGFGATYFGLQARQFARR
jgi:SPW repeat